MRPHLPWPVRSALAGTAGTASMTLAYAALGRTPVPWRWPAAVLATSVGPHAAYVLAVAGLDDRVRRGVR